MWKKGISGLLWGLAIVMVYSVLFGRTISGYETGVNKTVSVMAGEEAHFIVIDSGHGFFDAGKIGVSGALEKDINLAIALKLKADLESQGFHVRMTRENDVQLYDGMRPSDKKEDMQKRVSLMTDENCILAVSIHQNSFTEEKYRGAQVFYYGQSENGKKLAEILQTALIEQVDPDNHRAAKANESYYLLKKTPTPTVIVECGFLSNPTEAELLLQDDYQDQLVNAIYTGIKTYLGDELPQSESS